MIKKCLYCNKEFKPKKNTQKYCSRECSRDIQRKPLEVCKQCGKEFKHKTNSTNTFCTRECGIKWKAEHKLSDEERKKRSVKKFCKIHINECEECGKKFISKRKRKYCSDECAKIKHARVEREKQFRVKSAKKICVICNKEFIGLPSKKVCSEDCKIKYKKNEKREYRRKARRDGRVARYSHKRRCKKFGGLYDNGISLKKLRQRDGNRCLVCGAKVLEVNLNGYHKRNATIGHLIPLSKGGSHTWSNIQLECMDCNTKIGAVSHGQSRLAV